MQKNSKFSEIDKLVKDMLFMVRIRELTDKYFLLSNP